MGNVHGSRLLCAGILLFITTLPCLGQEETTPSPVQKSSTLQQLSPDQQAKPVIVPSQQPAEQELVQPPVLQFPTALPQLSSVPAQMPRLQEGSYLFIYRTPAHVQRSDPDTFHNSARAVRELLRSHQVSVFEDPVRGTIETAETFSMESVLNLAREAGATYLLYVTIDRPVTKWLKISVQCYDLNGKMLWQEDAAHGGGWNSSESLKKITNELEKRLERRFGAAGLPTILKGTEEKPDGKGGELP